MTVHPSHLKKIFNMLGYLLLSFFIFLPVLYFRFGSVQLPTALLVGGLPILSSLVLFHMGRSKITLTDDTITIQIVAPQRIPFADIASTTIDVLGFSVNRYRPDDKITALHLFITQTSGSKTKVRLEFFADWQTIISTLQKKLPQKTTITPSAQARIKELGAAVTK